MAKPKSHPPTLDAAAQVRMEANLRSLQKTDPSILSISGSATYCVTYQLLGVPPAPPKWEKKNIEGALFIARCNGNTYKLVVLNRNSPTNHVQTLNGGIQTKIMQQILMLKDGSTILGLYFHDEEERTSIHTCINETLQAINDGGGDDSSGGGGGTTPTPQPQHSTNSEKVDPIATGSLLSMLGINPASNQTDNNNNNNNNGGQLPPTPPSSDTQPATILDKQALKLTLLSLIQDDRFLDLIHSQYAKVAQAKGLGLTVVTSKDQKK